MFSLHVFDTFYQKMFNQNEVLLKLVQENSNLFGDKAHFEVGDGAPIHALNALMRCALSIHRGRPQPDSVAEDDLIAAQDDSEGGLEDAGPLREEGDGDASVDTDSSASSTSSKRWHFE